MTLQFDTRPAAYAVIVRDGKILLAYWKQDGKEGWTLPGGGLDLAEHPVDGCRREVFEETGSKLNRVSVVDTALRLHRERPADGKPS
ncbi:NUDIX hydrolase [Paenarthrobacter sp. YAF11_1]|uniref:NUDIX hydrolase n=1 Tax=Paenarthrobacter sp. YAF11_1 TaxID=3233074 RepID=UPI003F9B994A